MTPCQNLKEHMSTCYESENMFHIGVDHTNIIPMRDHSAFQSYKLANSNAHFKNGLDYYFSNKENVELFSNDCNNTQNTELDYTYSIPVRCTEFTGMTNIDFQSNCILSGTEPRLKDVIDFSCHNIKLGYDLSELSYKRGVNSGMLLSCSTMIISSIFFIGCLKLYLGKLDKSPQIPVRVPQIITARSNVIEAATKPQQPPVSDQNSYAYHSLA